MVIDFTKENPLKTILKNGKIPVIRVSDEGFKNYDQTDYAKSREEHLKGKTVPSGCFVHVGGIQARYVSGSHYDEKLNIGFVDPETEIFCTYKASKNNINGFSYNKAKAKFKDVIEGYDETFKKEKGLITSGELEDFDLVSEAIVKAEDVTTVAVVEPKDFYQFVPFINDDYLRILCADLILSYTADGKTMPQAYLEHMGEQSFYEDLEHYHNDHYGFDPHGTRRFAYFNDFFEYDQTFKDMALIEFVNCFMQKKFTYPKQRIQSLKKSLLSFNEFKKEKHVWYEKSVANVDIHNNTQYLSVHFNISSFHNPYKWEELSFTIFNDDFRIIEKTRNEEYYKQAMALWGTDKKPTVPKYNHQILTVKDMYKNKYRYLMYDFLMIYNKYCETFSSFFEIFHLKDFDILNAMLDIEQTFKSQNKDYKINDVHQEITVIEKDFILEYNLILQDSIITIHNSEKTYYNIENVPKEFDKTILMEIIDVIESKILGFI